MDGDRRSVHRVSGTALIALLPLLAGACTDRPGKDFSQRETTGSTSQGLANEVFLDAEDMAVSGGWVLWNYKPNDWMEAPVGLQALNGASAAAGEATATVDIPAAGDYAVWVRYVDWHDLPSVSRRGPFRVKVVQGSERADHVFDTVGVRETPQSEKAYGDGAGRSVWVRIPASASLVAGSAQIVMTKETPYAQTSFPRKIDCFVLTTDSSAVPDEHSYVPQVYARVTAKPSQSEPFGVHLIGDLPWNQGEPWPTLSEVEDHNFVKNEVCKGPLPCLQAAKRLHPGDSSSWFNLTPFLGLMGDNRLNFRATVDFYNTIDHGEFTLQLSNTPDDTGVFHTFEVTGDPSAVPNAAVLDVTLDINNRAAARSDAEWSAEANGWANLSSPGARPATFPVMTGMHAPAQLSRQTVDNEISTMQRLGYNGIANPSAPVLVQNGLNHPYFKTAVWTNDLIDGSFNDPDIPSVQDRLTKALAPLVANGLQQDHAFVSLMDEPNLIPSHFAKFITDPIGNAEFDAWLQGRGLTPADFGKSNWSEVNVTDDRVLEPRAYYESRRFIAKTLSNFFKDATGIAQAIVSTARTTVNFAESSTFYGNMYRDGIDWFTMLRDQALTYGLTEDHLNTSTTYQLAGYRADLLRGACRPAGQSMGMYSVVALSKKPWDIGSKAAAEIGHGAQALNLYSYGPFYHYQSADTYSRAQELYQEVKDVSYAIGGTEDYLVGAKVPRSRVAFLYPATTDIWTLDQAYSLYGKERMLLWLLLNHMGYRVEIVSEDEVEEGKLDDYEALFLIGSHIRSDIVADIGAWVDAGGFLYLGAGSGARDEANGPSTLDQKIGFVPPSFNPTYANKNLTERVGLPLYPNLNTVTYDGKALESLIGVQVAPVAGAEVVARFQNGDPAVQIWNRNAGRVVFAGFLPGLAYAKSGVVATAAAEAALPPGVDRHTHNPPSYNADYRALMQNIMDRLNYKPRVVTNNPLVEGNLLEANDGLVVTLSNWSESPIEDLAVTVKYTMPVGAPQATRGTATDVASGDRTVSFKIDLEHLDFVKLPYAAYQQENTTEALVTIEAEHYRSKVARSEHDWKLTRAYTPYLGDGAMEAAENTGMERVTGYSTTSPQMDFPINFVKGGTHYVWIRGRRKSGVNDNTVHIGLDGQESSTSDNHQTPSATAFTWTRVTADGPVASISVTPGLHTLNVWMREDGFILDRIIVTRSGLFTPAADGDSFQDQGREGLLVLEAEGYRTNTAGSGAGSGASWILTTEYPDYSGSGAMRASPNSGLDLGTNIGSSPRLDFRVEILKTGTHYLWLRARRAVNDGDDTVNVGLDGQLVPTSTGVKVDSDSFTWVRATIGGPEVATMSIAPGLHTVNVWMREDGFVLDKVLLTTDPEYAPPTGPGPAASERG
jgi:hypothetical protein